MKSESQTWTSTLLNYVSAWRRRDGLSVSAAATTIVEAYQANGEPTVGGAFKKSNDIFDDARVNGQRIFRWLDDQTKDTNLLPANFAPATLLALPEDLRLRAVNELLAPIGLIAEPICSGSQAVDFSNTLSRLCKESGEATSALAALTDGIQAGELEKARSELQDALCVTQAALHQVERQMGVGGNG